MIPTKANVRAEALARRAAHVAEMPAPARSHAATLLARTVEAHLQNAKVVAAYLSIGAEIDSLPLIDRLARRGLTLALPHVTTRDRPLRFLIWAPDDEVIAGPMGVHQPIATAREVEPDLILTPLLAFDSRLHRLGYGAGFYDRAFARHPTARRVGLAWHIQQVDPLPIDRWDVPLHAVATDTGLIEL